MVCNKVFCQALCKLPISLNPCDPNEMTVDIKKKKPFFRSKFFGFLVFFFLIYVVAEITGIRENFSPGYIQSLFKENMVSSIAIFALLFIIGNFLHVPGGVFLVGAILALGKVEGGIITCCIAIVSCMVSFFVIGYFAKGSLDKVNHPLINKFIHQIDTHPIRTVFILRFFIQSGPILNYALATTSVSAKNYFIGTILGLPIPTAAYCFFFDYFIQVFK